MIAMANSAGADLNNSVSAQQGAALQQSHWSRLRGLSRVLAACERFLAGAAFDRAPWLAVAFGAGIAAWFGMAGQTQWIAMILACLAASLAAPAFLRAEGRFPFVRQALIVLPLIFAAGIGIVWAKSTLVGRAFIRAPQVSEIQARVLSREERPADRIVRLVLATRDAEGGRPIRVRVNLPAEHDRPGIGRGAVLRMKARLMPPAPPMLPGGYDFARTAWFKGLSATGTVLGPVEIVAAAGRDSPIDAAQAVLSRHVRASLDGSAGAIAAALASGDRGAIDEDDDRAMRDSGLAHLLSISGLHVSAVVAAAYLVALRVLGLWTWLAVRVRLPLVAAGAGAAAGIGYTLLTGAEVPTVRSCIGAVLVLAALALGREPLSMRMIAAGAFVVLAFWPESIVGPSFQMSFAAVMAIVALHSSGWARRHFSRRDEGWLLRGLRYFGALLATGIVIEIALMPIGLFHFHRSGIYGALANLVAIPLTTAVTMPLIALALLLDVAGAGAPAWWLAGKSLDLMIGMAHWIAAQPGAVKTLPAMGSWRMALFAAGGIWLALWQGRVRYFGLAVAAVAAISLLLLPTPDILVSGDGRHVGIVGANGELIVVRGGGQSYARDNLTELSGNRGAVRLLADMPGARCNADFCAFDLVRGERTWNLLISRGKDWVPYRALAAACERSDIVIADRRLPAVCRPRWLKADRALLGRTGGLAIDLAGPGLTTVAQSQGQHGWWQPALRRAAPAGGRGDAARGRAPQ